MKNKSISYSKLYQTIKERYKNDPEYRDHILNITKKYYRKIIDNLQPSYLASILRIKGIPVYKEDYDKKEYSELMDKQKRSIKAKRNLKNESKGKKQKKGHMSNT